MGKKLYLANFNVTYGEKDEPMLTYFKEILYPVFVSKEAVRYRGDDFLVFNDVKLKQRENGELTLVGNLVKKITLEVKTDMVNGKLISKNESHPSAPYSRFILFLKNHRLIFVKNETYSPTLSNLETILKKLTGSLLHKYKLDGGYEFPRPKIHIIDLPSSEEIKRVLEDTAKINKFTIRLFPLNGDLDFSGLHKNIRESMGIVGCDTANLNYNSPTSKKEIRNIIEQTGGLADYNLKVTRQDGTIEVITKSKLTTSKDFKSEENNISEKEDESLIKVAEENPRIIEVSEENKSIYEKFKEILKSIML